MHTPHDELTHGEYLPEEQEPKSASDGSDVVSRVTGHAAIEAKAHVADAFQVEGFKTPDEFEEAVLVGNEKAREEAREYLKSSLSYVLWAHNGEVPHSVILCECSDGRNGGPEMFANDPRIRFAKTWKPQAGLIMFPELKDALDQQDPAAAFDALLADEERKKSLFDQAEALFAKDIERQMKLSSAAIIAGKRIAGPHYRAPEGTNASVLRLADTLQKQSGVDLEERLHAQGEKLRKKILGLGEHFPISIELQSHSDAHHPDHGCGAHGSNLGKALDMSVLNALLLERYLAERHPEVANDVRISLTHHKTGMEEEVLDVYQPELLKHVDPELQKKLFKDHGESNRFQARFLKDREAGIVRRGKANPIGIDKEHHDEYIIRISELHKAFALESTSVLEQSMLPNVDLMEAIACKLVSIAQGNRIKRDAEKEVEQPIFIHLDHPALDAIDPAPGDADLINKYEELAQRLEKNAVLKPLIAQGKVFLLRSKTKPFRFADPDRIQTTFLD